MNHPNSLCSNSVDPKYSSVRSLLKGFGLLSGLILSAAALATPGSGNDEWTTPLGTLNGARYSTLTQINSTNASTLVQERYILTGTSGGHEGQPLVVNVLIGGVPTPVMYVVTPYPNNLIATNATTGAVLWTYKPATSESAKAVACCDVVNRGASYANGVVVYTRLDGVVVAVNAVTGALVWQTKIANPTIGETLTGAPIIAGGLTTTGQKVIVGVAGGEMGVRGWVKGLSLTNGAVIWTAYSTGPDTDVKINANNNFYPKDRGVNLGTSTWTGGANASTNTVGSNLWKQGGGSVWNWFTYNSSLNLVFYGTSNPGVWNATMRPGDNKWSSAIFARNPDTGVAQWVTQLTPHDAWDYDAMNESIVISTADSPSGIALMHFNKNGFAYMLDANTGRIIKADKFVNANWADSINLSTGNPVLSSLSTANPTTEGTVSPPICPSPLGGKEHSPASYSLSSGLFYVPSINFCSTLEPLKANYIAGSPFMGAHLGFVPDFSGPGGSMKSFGALVAWNPSTRQAQWTYPEAAPLFGGVLSTAGGVVFYGTLDRKFKVLNASTGALLASLPLECGVMSNPITYMGTDGKQRVAIYSGIGWLVAGFGQPAGKCPSGTGANAGYAGGTSGAVHIFKLP